MPRLVFAKGRYSLIRLMFYMGTFTPEPRTSPLSKSETIVRRREPDYKGVDFFLGWQTELEDQPDLTPAGLSGR